uniref:Extensin-like n=1 Tax=Knipowitschia caucasica TaxID=637954 RepID=A0AAV2L9C1_KNICA
MTDFHSSSTTRLLSSPLQTHQNGQIISTSQAHAYNSYLSDFIILSSRKLTSHSSSSRYPHPQPVPDTPRTDIKRRLTSSLFTPRRSLPVQTKPITSMTLTADSTYSCTKKPSPSPEALASQRPQPILQLKLLTQTIPDPPLRTPTHKSLPPPPATTPLQPSYPSRHDFTLPHHPPAPPPFISVTDTPSMPQSFPLLLRV